MIRFITLAVFFWSSLLFADTPGQPPLIGSPANGLSVSGRTISLGLSSGSTIGALSSSDWSTFNSKQSALTFNSPLVNTSGTITCNVASGSQAGCLASGDWTTFNGKGSVSSVSLSDGSTTPIFSISGSPVTTTGTLTHTLTTQAKNLVFAGPSSGANAQPSFRALVQADVPNLSWNYTSQSTTYSAKANDYIAASGASFTITLPTAASIAGQLIAIQHTGTSETNLYTLNTTSAQTIGGVASGSYVLHTNGEFLLLASDGSNWQIVLHRADFAWASCTPQDFGTSFGTVSTSSVFCKRQGDYLFYRGDFVAGTVTTGGNHIRLPSGYPQVDTSKMPSNQGSNKFPVVGNGGGTQLMAMIFDSGNPTYIQFSTDGHSTCNGSTAVVTGGTATFQAMVPITGWQP